MKMPDEVVEKMVSNCNKKLTKQIRDKAKEEGMTVDQMITLASMIQAEAADKDDMYQGFVGISQPSDKQRQYASAS